MVLVKKHNIPVNKIEIKLMVDSFIGLGHMHCMPMVNNDLCMAINE